MAIGFGRNAHEGDGNLSEEELADPRYTITTVCTGNICRSPMAEIILRSRVEERGLQDRIRVMSSGVSDEEYGHPIDPRAVRVLKKRGYPIPAHHFAHRITDDEIKVTDLFLPMTADHMRMLVREIPAADRGKVRMYRSFDPRFVANPPKSPYQMDLVDPWYGGPADFEIAIDQIDENAPYILDWVVSQLPGA